MGDCSSWDGKIIVTGDDFRQILQWFGVVCTSHRCLPPPVPPLARNGSTQAAHINTLVFRAGANNSDLRLLGEWQVRIGNGTEEDARWRVCSIRA